MLQQKACAYGTMERAKRLTKMREDRVKYLGSSLISTMEWGYMRKCLDGATRHLPKGKRLEKRKEIAELWAEGQRRVKGASL